MQYSPPSLTNWRNNRLPNPLPFPPPLAGSKRTNNCYLRSHLTASADSRGQSSCFYVLILPISLSLFSSARSFLHPTRRLARHRPRSQLATDYLQFPSLWIPDYARCLVPRPQGQFRLLQSLYIHYHYHSRRRSFCPWSRLCSLCLAFLRSSVPPLQDTITPAPRSCPPSRAPVIHRAFFPPDHMGRPSTISTEASHVLLTFPLRQWK